MIRNARTNLGPYHTIKLNHNDFLDWSEVCSAIFPSRHILKDTNNCIVKFKKIRKINLTKNSTDLQIACSFKINNENN